MRNGIKMALRLALVLAIAPAAYGCRTAATVGAGAAAGAVAASTVDQNVTATLATPISEVDRRARAVFASMGMAITAAEFQDNATEREYDARSGDNIAHIKMVAEGDRTKVSVSYRRGRVDYSKTEAQNILDRIQAAR